MDEVKLLKLLGTKDVLLAAHEIVGDVMEWGLENENTMQEAMNYLFGMHDLVARLLREIGGE